MGCKYCEVDYPVIDGETIIDFYENEAEDYDCNVYIVKGRIFVSNDYCTTAKNINFCPMCGRNLEGEHDRVEKRLTNYEWIQKATKQELAEEMQKIAHWNRKELAKAEFYHDDFYMYWLGQERKTAED